MNKVETGALVKLHYKGTFPNGETFDDSRQSIGQPIECIVGAGKLLRAFESALVGMKTGEIKNVFLKTEQAYGPPNPNLIGEVPRSAFPEDYEFQIGMPVKGTNSETGRTQLAVIVSWTDDKVTIDMNHPLAGKDVNFEIEVMSFENAEIPAQDETKSLEDHTVKELRRLAKIKKIRGFSAMKKAELVESLST
tara:strand:+ start:145 stop:723 length:579 start_codon:yes stop_codon:yes gene_type:complete